MRSKTLENQILLPSVPKPLSLIKEFICFANKDFYALPCLFYSYLELRELGSLK